MIPVTYYPTSTQRQLQKNRELVADKPYAHFFREDMWLREEALPALKAPMDPALALRTTSSDLNRLLEPGYHEVETGYCALPDGTGYTTSLTIFPGATAEMLRWWFWWHSVEAARYTLWFPWNHVSALAQNRDVLTAPGLTDEQRYIGNTHNIDEYIGADLQKIAISFVDPGELGIDAAAMPAAGIHASACGHVYLRRPWLYSATMVHLVRDTDEGFELRSRYRLGDRISLGRGNRALDLDRLAGTLGLKARLAGGRLAYEQLLHDQIEITHLAGILPGLYAEFGPGKNSE
ncbi:DAPG hydrolase family protein [Dietzia timorensis]|uniref:DAPG hydrolase PhiG domain-containing protein n=2 Tax=Dietzia timorensis TaxID=499555 RepID=A0A173LQZ2_9ACTN|nr:hypothetical protein [Dietzia timorensis]ANI93302.1 Hypothetical protein BJL86_2542 [Dietzia timorensis]